MDDVVTRNGVVARIFQLSRPMIPNTATWEQAPYNDEKEAEVRERLFAMAEYRAELQILNFGDMFGIDEVANA